MIKIERKSMQLSGLKLQKPVSAVSSLAPGNGLITKERQIRLDVRSDYACPVCYLEETVLNRISAEDQDHLILEWRAFELGPEPFPSLDPDGDYLHAIWNRAVYPMAHLRGLKLRLPPVQP